MPTVSSSDENGGDAETLQRSRHSRAIGGIVDGCCALLAAVAQGALAITLGALARSLSGASQVAHDVTAMTPMSRWAASTIESVTPRALAATGLALVTLRALAHVRLVASEVSAGASKAAEARRRVLAVALRSPGEISLGRAISWPLALESGERAARARWRAILQLVVLGVAAVLLDLRLTLLLIALLVPFTLILRPVRRALRRLHVAASSGVADTVDAVRDVVEHAALWAACGAHATATRRVTSLTDDGRALALRATVGQTLSSASNEILAGIAIVALVVAFGGGTRAASLVPLLVVLVSTYRPLRELTEAAPALARAEIARAEVAALSSSEEALHSSQLSSLSQDATFAPATLTASGLALDIGSEVVRGGVEFAVEPGEILVVVGAPGTGKSALLEAMVGARRIVSGSLRHGDRELRGTPLGPRHRPMAWVPPSPPVLPGTLAENLAPDAPADRHRIERARDVLRALGDQTLGALGDDARLGPFGHRPSSGEAQRLALARTLAGDALVLLLDEPTAHLDAHSEELAIAELARAARSGRTVIVVTHRPAPRALATRLLSLDPPDEPAQGASKGASSGAYAQRNPTVASRRSVG